MSCLRLGPNWIVLPFDLCGPSRGATWTPRVPVSAKWEYKALSACNRRAGTPYMGASEQDTRPKASPIVLGILLRLCPGRSGLGWNLIGSMYRGLWREHTALRALDPRTSPPT